MTKKKPELSILAGPTGKPFKTSEASFDLAQTSLKIVGFPGTGKSSFMQAWSKFGFNPFFLPTQPGLENLTVNQPTDAEGNRLIVTTYDEALQWLTWAALETDFNPIVIDPTAPLYDPICLKYIEEKTGTHPATPTMGVGWFWARDAFQSLVGPILHANKAIVFIAHLSMKEIYVKGQVVETKISDNLGQSKVAALIDQLVAMELHFDVRVNEKTGEDEWFARVRKTASGIAKDRTGIFRDTPEFDRGHSAEEAAKNFLGRFYELD